MGIGRPERDAASTAAAAAAIGRSASELESSTNHPSPLAGELKTNPKNHRGFPEFMTVGANGAAGSRGEGGSGKKLVSAVSSLSWPTSNYH